MSLTTPLAMINEQLSPASSISETRRPSRYHTTNPQIIPKERPLKNIAAILRSFGNTANRSSASSAARIMVTSIGIRLFRVTSLQTLIPITFESA